MLRRYMVTSCLECTYSRYDDDKGTWCVHDLMHDEILDNPISELCVTIAPWDLTYPTGGCCYFTRRTTCCSQC